MNLSLMLTIIAFVENIVFLLHAQKPGETGYYY
jgi:hypothetical protein